jgi:hypothetical protein
MKPAPAVRKSPAPLLALLAAALLLAGCAYELVRGGQVNQAKAQEIEAGIQELRDLRFKHHVPLVVRTPDEAEKMMEADLERDYSDEQLRVGGTAGALVGLYPPEMDLKAESLKLLKSQVAAFYDPHEKQMVLVEGQLGAGFFGNAAEFLLRRDVVGEMVVAHELTHALQDQNFDLDHKLEALKDDDDRSLALKSVAEGDATLAGFAYVMGGMSNANADTLVDHLKELPQAFAAESPDTPEGLSEPMMFEYSDGARFVAEAYRRGGWAAVDKLYEDPPQSSRQIVHPALYFDRPTPPLEIEISGYKQVMAGWSRADDDTYGELLLRLILQRNLGKDSREVDLAREWAGDHMLILQQQRGVTVIWVVAFADEAAASHFAVVYATVLDRLLDGVTEHHVEYRGDAALVIIGEGAHYAQTLAPSIWQESRIAPRTVASHVVRASAAPLPR